jgi:hypothetical protein
MNEPIEESYFNWLYSKVAHVDNPTPSLSYWTLLRDLHSIEFVWLIQGDDNRAEDGLDVRREFYNQLQFDLDEEIHWMYLGCSVLEMLIAFSRRAEFQTDTSAREWFWEFLENLELADLNDSTNDIHVNIAEVMDRFIWRTYDYNGQGGMFPLQNPEHDQRKVEIWYQFCEYLVDRDLI